jgi:hypothetical protein
MTPVAPNEADFAERCDMAPNKELQHALLFKWGKFQLGAYGVPAIVAVILIAVIGAKWVGIL